MSIWNGIDRTAFEANVTKLHKIAPTQKPERYSPASTAKRKLPPGRQNAVHGLPEDLEKYLSDDFAFVAAWEGSPDCVAAATVVGSKDRLGLSITLAANEGIATSVTDAFESIVGVLEICSRNCESARRQRTIFTLTSLQAEPRQLYTDQCLDIVITLHRNKILGRLGSKKFCRDKRWPSRELVSVVDRLREMNESSPGIGHSYDEPARTHLLEQISVLREAIEDVERTTALDVHALKKVLEAASAITADNKTLTAKLRRAGYPAGFEDRKEIRQITALGRYVRFCNYIVGAARSYRRHFRDVTVVSIPPYAIEFWPTKRHKHFVHAEIQLLVHHDMNSGNLLPRYIGVSKKACFLCFCFLRAYSGYSIPETHGEVLPQWTIPERQDYTLSTWRRMNRALLATSQDVQLALDGANRTDVRHAPQIQSIVNSVAASFKSVSTSTLRPASILERKVMRHEQDSDVNVPDKAEVHGEMMGTRFNISIVSDDLKKESPVLRTLNDRSVTQNNSTGHSVFTDEWLELFLPLEYSISERLNDERGRLVDSLTEDHSNGILGKHFSARPHPEIISEELVIKVADLNTDTRTILEEQPNADYIEFRFIHPSQRDIRVRLVRR